MKPANPENVPIDKIPDGWRLICEEEYGKTMPVKVWSSPPDKHKFSPEIESSPSVRRFTYITPDLPDNGQPWHAHKPGDPAPVEDDVNVDLVCRGGKIYTRQISADWLALPNARDTDILFYRLHEPAVKQPAKITPTSDRILSILIAAGHITEEQVEQARKLVKP